jgi:hypothetical protein
MTGDSTPQFSTVEFAPQLVDTHAHFTRALVFGFVGALVGLALYATVIIITNYEIGLVSLAVGWIVGKSILFGSDGRTGRRYQIAAAAFTYFAVTVAIIPVAFVQIMRGDVVIEQTIPAGQGATGGSGALGTSSTAGTADVSTIPVSDEERPPIPIVSALFQLLLLGLAAPFMNLQNMPDGLIGAVILAIGIHIAWKLTGGQQAVVAQALAQPTEAKPTSLDINR